MTERVADISARIEGIRQLGSVVAAMRGIAAARVQQARGQLVAVDAYAATIAAAIGRACALLADGAGGNAAKARVALVVFGAEQGFAGAFTERVLDQAATTPGDLFLIGTRAQGIAAEHGLVPAWHCAMPAHSPGIPRLADRIAEALYARLASGEIDRLVAIHSVWRPGHGIAVERRQLFPLDLSSFPRGDAPDPPLLNLPPAALLAELTADYVHAQLCHAALHAFAAENQARMEAMAAARGQIDRQLETLRGRQRQMRQEEITAEIIELAAGETAHREGREAGRI